MTTLRNPIYRSLAATFAVLGAAAPAAAQWNPSPNGIFFDKGHVGIGVGAAPADSALWAQTFDANQAIFATNYKKTGSAYAVSGFLYGPNGAALRGFATSGNGKSHGVTGTAGSPDGFGVGAFNGAKLGGTAMYASSKGVDGVGVYAESRALSGKGYGVLAVSYSQDGVRGDSFAPSGHGLHGEANAKYGVGVLANATGVGGVGTWSVGRDYGVRGFCSTQYGVAGVIGSANNVKSYGVFSQGDFGGTGAKYFVQPHPTNPAVNVRFVCLEGNESGTYFRGSTRLVDGRAEIEIPPEWTAVTEATGITVQVTTIRSLAVVTVMEKARDRIVIAGSEDCEFDYFVNGLRRGFADYQPMTINREFRPAVKRVPFGSQYPAALREILVENGILNPDFTPNEDTAARLGWQLQDPEAVPAARLDSARSTPQHSMAQMR